MSINIADLNLADLDKELPVAIAGPVEGLRARAARLLDTMQPRVQLSNGALGYRAKAQTIIEVVAGPDPDSTTAPRETLALEAGESEIQVDDPVLTLDGMLRLDLEIVSYVAAGTSTVLFPGQEVRLIVGRSSDHTLPKSYGRLEIPLGSDFPNTPVPSLQFISLAVETPMGRLTNPEPARMTAPSYGIPPIGTSFTQDGHVPLLDAAGNRIGTKIATDTRLTELIK